MCLEIVEDVTIFPFEETDSSHRINKRINNARALKIHAFILSICQFKATLISMEYNFIFSINIKALTINSHNTIKSINLRRNSNCDPGYIFRRNIYYISVYFSMNLCKSIPKVYWMNADPIRTKISIFNSIKINTIRIFIYWWLINHPSNNFFIKLNYTHKTMVKFLYP